MRKFLPILLLLLLAPSARATVRTFYIDYGSGSNSNAGTQASPWKSHPYMQNASGCGGALPSYTHQTGDQFIFKGGVTWPAACFGMNIPSGGSSSTPDYYGTCGGQSSAPAACSGTTWPASGWTRPVFNPSTAPTGVSTPGGTSQAVITIQANYVTIDNLENSGQYIPYANSLIFGGTAFVNAYGSSCGSYTGILIENIYSHGFFSNDQFSSTTGYGKFDAGNAAGCGVTEQNSTIDDTAGYAYNQNGVKITTPIGGACRNCATVTKNTFANVIAACFTVPVCTYNEGYGASQTYWYLAVSSGGFGMSSSVAPHTQLAEDDYISDTVSEIIAFNYFHDSPNAGVCVYVPYWARVYRNVIKNCAQSILLGNYANVDTSSMVGYTVLNTVDCSAGGDCLNKDTKGAGKGTLYLEDNISITNGTASNITQGTCTTCMTTLITSSNASYTMPTSEATTYGFTAPTKYYPTNVNDANVNAQANNKTSLTSTLPGVNTDPQCAPWFGASCLTASATLAWDKGAFCLSNCSGASGPAFACSPASINWPNQPLGYSFNPAISTTCNNNGGSTLTISSIALSGGNAGDFAFTTSPSGGNCGTTVAAGSSCTISVTFTPSALGSRTTTLVITDNASTSPQNVAISGTASYFVQGCTSFTAGPQGSTSCTFPANQIGKSNYCTAFLYDTSDTITTMTDGTNTYNPVAAQTTQTSNGIQRSFLATSIANGSAPTVTANFGSSSTHHGGLNCGEYIVVNALDQTTTATGNSNAPNSGNLTIAGTNEVPVGTVISPTQVASPSAGWTQRGTADNFYADQIQNAGTYAATASFPSADYWIAQLSILTASAPQVATPTFSPGAGTYTSTQTVTISDATGSATICYTTDGSTPTANGAGTCTHGTTYSGTVSVSTNETLNAIGSKSGDTDSGVGSATYVIAPVITTPTFSPVAGTYSGPQTVTFTSSGFSPTFCSTLDGSTPTTNGAGSCTHGASGASVTVNASLDP